MNCKPGDIAQVYYLGALAEGYIVRVIKLNDAGHDNWKESWGPIWEIDQQVPRRISTRKDRVNTYPDSCLRPIRGGETPEESQEAMRLLTQIPKEEKV